MGMDSKTSATRAPPMIVRFLQTRTTEKGQSRSDPAVFFLFMQTRTSNITSYLLSKESLAWDPGTHASLLKLHHEKRVAY